MLDKNIVAAIQAATTVEAIYLAASITSEAKQLVSEWGAFGDSDNGTKTAPKDFQALWIASTEYAEVAQVAVHRLYHKQIFDYVLKSGPLDYDETTPENRVCAVNTILRNCRVKFRWDASESTTILKDDKSFLVLRFYLDTLQLTQWNDGSYVTVAPEESDWFTLVMATVDVVNGKLELKDLPTFFGDQ